MNKLSAMKRIEELRAIYLVKQISRERIKLENEIYDLIIIHFKSTKIYYRFRDENR